MNLEQALPFDFDCHCHFDFRRTAGAVKGKIVARYTAGARVPTAGPGRAPRHGGKAMTLIFIPILHSLLFIIHCKLNKHSLVLQVEECSQNFL